MMRLRGNPILHFADRYVGIPVVVCLGHLRRKGTVPSNIGTIGLLKTGAIGDTVLLSAVIADLRCTFRNAELIFFCNEVNFEIAGMLAGVDRVIKVPFRNLVAGMAAVRSVSVDVMLDFGQWSRLEALFTIFSKACFKIGFRSRGQHRHAGYDLTVEHSSEVHELENYRRLVRTLGVETRNLPSLLAPKGEPPLDREYAVCHLWPGGTGRELKQWPAERWVQLFAELAGWGMEIVLTGSPSDRARNEEVIAYLGRETRGIVKNAAGLSLDRTAAMLAHSKVVVSVNTGVMHLAAALGAPLVALHGPTSSKRWGPISETAIVVDSPAPGCGYLNHGWEYPAQPPQCMESIRYETVREACGELLKKSNRSSEGNLASTSSTMAFEQRAHEAVADD
jgi:ADP-heptose:LPS heptosyltransferase